MLTTILFFFFLNYTNLGLKFIFNLISIFYPSLKIGEINGSLHNMSLKNVYYKSNAYTCTIKNVNIIISKKFFKHLFINMDLIQAKDITFFTRSINNNLLEKKNFFSKSYSFIPKNVIFLCQNIQLKNLYYKDSKQCIFISNCSTGIEIKNKEIVFYSIVTRKIELKLKNNNFPKEFVDKKNTTFKNLEYIKKNLNLKLFIIKKILFSYYNNVFINNFTDDQFMVSDNNYTFLFYTNMNIIKKKDIFIIQNIDIKYCNLELHINGYILINKKKNLIFF